LRFAIYDLRIFPRSFVAASRQSAANQPKLKRAAFCRKPLRLFYHGRISPIVNLFCRNLGFGGDIIAKMTTDLDLLGQYARQNAQEAFAELVRRHVNLVYSAALRQVRSPQLAEEVAQSVFVDLARNASRFKPGTILTAWLYRVARRTAIDVVRQESLRQLREQIAVEMTNMNSNTSEWTQIEPLIDEAMDALDETDRSAILLRYFENKNLREVGATLGTSDDAAQKRVSRAVERLREFFSKRNVTIGASGLAVVISTNAVQAAPVGLAVTISTAALAGATVSASTIVATTKAIAMTTLQKAVVTATLAIVAGAGIYEAHQAAQLREQNQALQQQGREQIEQLQKERDTATNQVARLLAENSRLKSDFNQTELLKLRGEIGTFRKENNDLLKANQALQSKAAAGELTNQITAFDQSVLLKQHVTDAATSLLDAIRKYAAENGGQYPERLEQLAVSGDLKVTNFVGNLGLNDFELAEAGSTNFRGKKIMLRLRTPIRNPGEQSVMLEGGIDHDGTTFTEIYGVAE
jgi:RNA polymerase sigma factor (sigma-70 family)